MAVLKKTVVSLLACSVVASTLVGCSGSRQGTTQKKVDHSKYVTINMYNFGDPSNDSWKDVQAAMNDYIKKNTKLNCGIALHYMTWTDWQTNYATLLASGQPLDLVNSASDWLNLWTNAQKGAFTDLDSLLPTYAPDTWKGIPKSEWDSCRFNGKIVCIPEGQYTQWVNHGFMYRGDYAKQSGLFSDNKIHSWEDMGKYLGWVKQNKPGVIPWDAGKGYFANAEGWITSHTKYVPINLGADVATWSITSPTDFKVVVPWYQSTFVDFAKMMKTWGDAGYWKTDILNNSDDSKQMLEAGKSAVYQHHVQTFSTLKKDIERSNNQPGADLQMFGFWEETSNLEKLSVTHGCTCIGSHSANPERALELFNLIYSDKNFYMLLNYGIKDKTYFINSDNKIYTPASFDTNKSGYSADFWGGRLDKYEPVSDNVFDDYPAYSKSLSKIAFDNPIDGFAFDQTPVQTYISATDQVINSEMPAIAFGKAGDPAAAVDKFIKDFKAAGGDKVTDEVQKQLNAWQKSRSK